MSLKYVKVSLVTKRPSPKDHTYQIQKSQLLRIADEEHLSQKSYQLMSSPQTVLF